jgi:hypothetical protein
MEETTEQKARISLITPPDKLHNFHDTYTLVYPSSETKSQFQNLIENFEESINVYLYELKDDESAYSWLLDVVKYSDYVILDIDNFPPKHTDIISYLLGHSNVFWLTNGENEVYNTISKNRIYNLDWLYDQTGGQIET